MQVIKNETPAENEIAEKGQTIIPFEKFPSVTFAKNEINQVKSLIEKLNLRKRIIAEKLVEIIDEYDKNEFEIDLIKTDMELANRYTYIYKKEAEINEYIEKTIIPNIKEAVVNFNMLIEKAKVVGENDSILKSVIDSLDLKLADENYDFRINHYLAIKNYLNNKEKNEKGS